MGNSGSTRKITVVNEEGAGVIKVSDSVVRRLKEELDAKQGIRHAHKAQATTPSSSPLPPPPSDPAEELAPPLPPPSPIVTPEIQIPVTKDGNIEHESLGRFLEEAHLTALKIREEREEALLKLDSFWRQRLAALSEENASHMENMENKYHESVANVGKLLDRPKCGPVCVDLRSQVQQCYQDNQSATLNCAPIVKEFVACVHKARQECLEKLSS